MVKRIVLGTMLAASAALASSPLEYAMVKTTFKNGKSETARVRLARQKSELVDGYFPIWHVVYSGIILSQPFMAYRLYGRGK